TECQLEFIEYYGLHNLPEQENRPQEDIKSSGTGVASSHKLPRVGAGNRNWVLWENSSMFESLIHLDLSFVQGGIHFLANHFRMNQDP
ncbi:hypothetical protein STEG23_035317, partial [Scotinomys teguina]